WLVSLSLVSNAQFNFPFPTQNAVWTQYADHWSTGGWPPQYYGRTYTSYYMQELDTLIDGRSYAQVFDHTGMYAAGLRDSAGKVMIVPPGHQVEYLLYDFTIPEGVDTTLFVWMIQYEEVYSVSMHGAGPSGSGGRIVVQGEGYEWIEGVGCTAGLFMEPWINISGYSLGLECMSADDMKVYPVVAPGTCEITTSLPIHRAETPVVYPNPTADFLRVDLGRSLGPVQYVIHSYDGRSVQRGVAHGAWIEIDVAGLAEGAYSLSMTVSDRVHRSSFVKVVP
ncbi:MAG: T9SS type A sorting domain-containing protein, partial [Flavobacteriales bacterium]|nr:T9SS type A sorting domain-containing protein [Flavobacteriales bacterium]